MEKKELRQDKYLNYIVPLIVKGMHWGQEYIINSEDQETMIMDKLVDFISEELDKAREEGYEEGMKAILYPKLKRDKNGTIKREGWVDTSKFKEDK